jgi:uncharacterized protein (DUF302 family)
MHCFSICIARPFGDVLALAKQTLQRHGLAILGQIDVRKALQNYAAIDFGPCAILSACSLRLAKKAALSADDEIGPVLLTNVVIRERCPGTVEITAMDPTATMGSLNDVDMIQSANDLRCRLRAGIAEIDGLARFKSQSHGPTVPEGAAA